MKPEKHANSVELGQRSVAYGKGLPLLMNIRLGEEHQQFEMLVLKLHVFCFVN